MDLIFPELHGNELSRPTHLPELIFQFFPTGLSLILHGKQIKLFFQRKTVGILCRVAVQIHDPNHAGPARRIADRPHCEVNTGAEWNQDH
ncbi:MAG: hypothetical protein U0K37_00530 [Acutalibacteraceae bacterium]|nr:hypothetical protein [Acutalibacteraceae bacterium]